MPIDAKLTRLIRIRDTVILLGRGNFRSIKQEETLATRCRLLHASDAVCIRVTAMITRPNSQTARECYLANQYCTAMNIFRVSCRENA